MAGGGVLRMLVLVGMVLCVGTFPGRAAAWGAEGHIATCMIAETLLEPATWDAVNSLLPEYANGSFADLCTWADDVKWHYHWSSPLHYIDTPDFLCRYNYDRDCHNEQGDLGFCASGAIKNYTSQLTTYSPPVSSLPQAAQARETEYNLTEAFLFLAHIVGDIHQPLHVGFTSDHGGNTIMLHWYRRKENLHHVWDTDMIDRARDLYYDKSIPTMVDAILQNITNSGEGPPQLWSECPNGEIACPDTYAAEGISLACQYAYKNATPGSTLEDDYFLSRLPILESRLAQGGVRLAAILNRLFGGKNTSL